MPYVDYKKKDKIVIITMNRPERLNAFGREMGEGLADASKKINNDPDALVAILTGTGRSFCSGVDVKEYSERGAPFLEPLTVIDPYGSAELLKPIIAAINGYCLGAGFNLIAMRADMRIAAQSAIFGLPETARGIVTLCTPFYHQMPRAIAMELALTCENITAQRAYELGLLNKVVPDEELMPKAIEMAEKIASYPPMAVRMTKQTLMKTTEISGEAAILETYLFRESATSDVVEKGMKSWADAAKKPSH
jgi:enoyl-CoA hydratase/carnithine racemase